ncbi:hypothetical protein ACHAW5_009202 [Stephanodiscus triporus]|uniref:Trichohyalin-plectin-homology domain-containing protein n=1 Tax=Stephanodiscus triporus TaxID=2934178 RepID=A0ABD3PKY4_9STRA
MFMSTIAASQLQQRQRYQERVLRETQSFLAQQNNTQRRHDWEQRTNKLIDQREAVAITKNLLQQEQDELEKRKREMQSLRDGEMNGWKKTLQTSLEVTQEERMEQIRERAYELKAQREADRQAFVGECYERQWVDECDELRAIDSKATLDRMRKDQDAMIKNKTVSVEQEPRFATSLINKDESNEQARRRQASLEMKLALDRQVQWKKEQIEDMTRKRQLEEKEQLRQLAMLEEKARQSGKEAIEEARKNGEKMQQDLRLRAMEREKRKAMELEQNRILLQHVLDTERNRIQMEQAQRHVGKDAASKEEWLRGEEAIKDEKVNDHIDETRKNQSDRLVKVNDDRMAAEADAKRRWMQEVDASRQEQIRRKRIEAETLRKEKEQDMAEIKAALLRAEDADKRNAEKALALRIETMLENKRCIGQQEKESEKKRQERHFIQEQIQNDERVHQKRLDEQRKRRGFGDHN